MYALVIAYGIGLAIGVWLGAHRLSGAVGEPLLVALYSIPKITLYPVILLIFGLGISGKVAFGALHGILPVALLTMAAIRNIPPVYLKAARTLHLTNWQTILTVLLPATLPEVVAGLRIGLTVTRGETNVEYQVTRKVPIEKTRTMADGTSETRTEFVDATEVFHKRKIIDAYPKPIEPLPYVAYGETESNLFCTPKGLDAAKLKKS